jgi:hypothetical protein
MGDAFDMFVPSHESLLTWMREMEPTRVHVGPGENAGALLAMLERRDVKAH